MDSRPGVVSTFKPILAVPLFINILGFGESLRALKATGPQAQDSW
jgi:hypothetical protein